MSGRSPHGERGLKSREVFATANQMSRSPHGERGLKFMEQFLVNVSQHVALLMESVD